MTSSPERHSFAETGSEGRRHLEGSDAPRPWDAEWFAGNVINPFLNASVVDVCNVAIESGKLLSGTADKKSDAIDYAAALPVTKSNLGSTEWWLQNISAGLGCAVTYGLAGGFTGGILRNVAGAFRLERTSLVVSRFAANNRVAQVLGVGVYDSLRPLAEGDTRAGNGISGAGSFAVLELGNSLVAKSRFGIGTGLVRALGRASVGVCAADTHHFLANSISHKSDTEEPEVKYENRVTGAAMNVVLPMVHNGLTRAADLGNAFMGRGTTLDGYVQKNGLLNRSSTFDNLVRNNPLVRVKVTDDTIAKALHTENTILVPKLVSLDVLGHELEHLSKYKDKAIRNSTDAGMNGVRKLLRENRFAEAEEAYIAIRMAEELRARTTEATIQKELGAKKNSQDMHPGLIAEDPFYRRIFATEFDQMNSDRRVNEHDYISDRLKELVAKNDVKGTIDYLFPSMPAFSKEILHDSVMAWTQREGRRGQKRGDNASLLLGLKGDVFTKLVSKALVDKCWQLHPHRDAGEWMKSLREFANESVDLSQFEPAFEKYNAVQERAWNDYEQIDAPARERYRNLTETASSEYHAIYEPASKQYHAIRESAEMQQKVTCRQARAEYEEIKNQAWEQYRQVFDPAFKQYMQTKQQAREKLDPTNKDSREAYKAIKSQAWQQLQLVSEPALIQYETLRKQAIKKLEPIHDRAWKTSLKETEQAWKQYEQISDAPNKKYCAIEDEASKEYHAIIDPAYEQYRAVRDLASAEFFSSIRPLSLETDLDFAKVYEDLRQEYSFDNMEAEDRNASPYDPRWTNYVRLVNTFGNQSEIWLSKQAEKQISLHDATYWLPLKPAFELKGLGNFLMANRDRNRVHLGLIAKCWPKLSLEERKLSFDKLLEESINKTYVNAKAPHFAREAAKWGTDERDYPELERLYLRSQSVPSPFPLGQVWTESGLVGRFLPRDDVRGMFLGQYTYCCQHPDGEGSGCADYGQESPNAGFFVVENENTGEILGQSFTWKNDAGGVCFDNIEGQRHKIAARTDAVASIYQQAANYLVQNAGFNMVTMGTKNSDLDLTRWTSAGKMKCKRPNDYTGITDADEQVLLSN